MAGRLARIRIGLGASCGLLVALAAPLSTAQAPRLPLLHFAIPAGSLQAALVAYASQTGQQLLYSTELVAGRRAAALRGDYAADEALGRLLEGTGLGVRRVSATMLVLHPEDGTAGPPAIPDVRGSGVTDAPRDAAALDVRDGDPAPSIAHPDDIVVTGTHIRGRNPGTPPVTTIGRDEMDRRGQATVAQALQALPGNFGGMATEQSALAFADPTGSNGGYSTGVDLRGLGADATLVLVNGQRIAGSGTMGAFADLSSIPTGALDHVEVLMDGASAIYGSDAVGGVVNILLRRHFEGAETRARFGGVTAGGKRDLQLDQTFGRQWQGGGVMLSYEYSRTGRLASADRAFARSSDSRLLGGTDHRSIASLPGNVIGFDPVTGALEVTHAIPGGQDGTHLDPGDFIAGATNLQNTRIDTDLIPRQVRHSAYATLDENLSDAVRLSADAHYSHRAFDVRLPGSVGVVQIGSANPWFVSPTGAASDLIAYAFAPEIGPIRNHGTAEALSTSLGLDADLGAGWKARGHAAFAQEREANILDHVVNSAALAEAVGAVPDDPATAFSTRVDGFFNPYGTGGANSRAILDFVGGGRSTSRTRARVWTGHADADGTLFTLPGGLVKLAVGGDVRRETFRARGSSLLSSDTPVPTASVSGAQVIEGVFAELRVPLVGPANALPAVRRLDLSIAGRVEHYSSFGTTANPKVGISWVPVEGLTLRSSYGTSFRAPNLRELKDAQQVSVTTLQRGADTTVPVIQLSGGNPGLKPEKAHSWTAGFDLAPTIVPHLSIGATWFRTVFSRRIATPANANFDQALVDPTLAPFVRNLSPLTSAADLATIEALLASPAFAGSNSFPASSIAAIIDTRFVNTGKVDVSGIDLTASYEIPAGSSRFDVTANGTYLIHYREQVTPTSPAIDKRDRVGEPVDLRGRLGLGWTRGAASAELGLNYVAPYHDLVGDRIASWKTVDLELGYTVPKDHGAASGLEIALAATNLFAAAPPFYDSPIGVGYDATNADALGRFVSLQLTKRW
jgi:outer membrane receptor protein involved in Fe transport